ncbi:lipoprotein [Mycoplasma mycoides]|uniref:lipoprotein n=1 Tax=Mycoplasma mycoides TaxID=2102 RepID=UPI0039059AB4
MRCLAKFNYLDILIKKLLTLLGSVAVIGSTAAVAIACEGKPLSVVKKEHKEETKTLESKKELESDSEKLQAGQSGEFSEKASYEEEKKELLKKEKELKQKLRDANQKYQDLIKEYGKGPLDTEKGKKLDKVESELEKANNDYENIKKEFEKLGLSLPGVVSGKETGKEAEKEAEKEAK